MPSAGPRPGDLFPFEREEAMSFWEQHEETEAEHVARERLPQNAPAECVFCGHFGADVLLAVCAACEPPARESR